VDDLPIFFKCVYLELTWNGFDDRRVLEKLKQILGGVQFDLKTGSRDGKSLRSEMAPHIARMLSLRDEGFSYRKIAAIFGLNGHTDKDTKGKVASCDRNENIEGKSIVKSTLSNVPVQICSIAGFIEFLKSRAIYTPSCTGLWLTNIRGARICCR